jgi:hypothetical protein
LFRQLFGRVDAAAAPLFEIGRSEEKGLETQIHVDWIDKVGFFINLPDDATNAIPA